ncbi:MAG TPA: hypothetical protein VNM90_09025, partial [Haliangium sp.]|nr:hypothetical protein [Haliangium sp.]
MTNILMEGGHPPGNLAMLTPELQEGYDQLRQLGIFDGIPHDVLSAALASSGIQRRTYKRDMFVADPGSVQGSSATICYVVEGQVAVAVFDSAELEQRRAEQERYEQMDEEER